LLDEKLRGLELFAKSVQLTLITRRETTNNLERKISQAKDAKLGLHLDRRLEKAHIHQAKTTWNPTEQDGCSPANRNSIEKKIAVVQGNP